MQRLDVGDAANAVPVAPAEKVANRAVVSHARVLVTDGGGKKLQEPACGLVAGVGDRREAPRLPSRVATARVRDGGLATCWLTRLV